MPNWLRSEILDISGCVKYDLVKEVKEGPYKGICADVVIFEIKDKFRLIVRPSGTEPKIKFYCSVNEPLANKADYKKVDAQLDAKVATIMTDLGV